MTLLTPRSPHARRALVLTVLGAATLAAGSTGVRAAAASPRTHTLHLTTTQLNDVLVKDADIASDEDRQDGSVTGYDVTSCLVNTRTHLASCDVALARAAGLIYGHVTVNVLTGRGSGRVTGGARGFADVEGRITVAPGVVANTSQITIRYHL